MKLIFLFFVLFGCVKEENPVLVENIGTGGFLNENSLVIKPETDWFWQLDGDLKTNKNVKVYDIDLFKYTSEEIESLKSKGHIVICYYSAGSVENWRDDIGDLPAEAIGNVLDGWPDEKWLDIKNSKVLSLNTSRMDLAVSKGCDGVEPDNVEAYAADSGFIITEEDQIEFNKFLAIEAHKRELSVGLKNVGPLVPQLVTYFDWSLTEECFQNSECAEYRPFIDAGKSVFQAEYQGKRDDACRESLENKFSLAFFQLDLNGEMVLCD